MASERIGLREAAERLGVHYMTVYHYVRTGRLPAERHGSTWSVDVADLATISQRPSRASATTKAAPKRGSSRAPRRHRLVERMVRGDEAGAWLIVESALASGATPSDIYQDLMAPALHDVGDRWVDGSISIADEHMASVVATRMVGRLGPRFARRGRTRGSVVVGTPSGESHSLPGAMLADQLRGAHFEVIDLGVNAPVESFVQTARGADRLVAVLIGVTRSGLDDTVRATIDGLTSIGAPVLVGGRAIVDEAHARRLGAVGWTGPSAMTAVAAVEALATSS